jgi:putative DNA primase/helicase
MNYQNIPDLLRVKPNWVVWGLPGEPLKAPFQPNSLLHLRPIPAKSGVSSTWDSFENAVQCVQRGLAQGIGYEFDGSGIYGVDLDHVIGDNGTITPEAQEIVEGLASYTEISPSGHGLHIFVTADNANITRHRKQGGFVEIYTNARYFTVTGNVYGDFHQIAHRSAELQQIHDRFLLPAPTPPVPIIRSPPISLADAEDTLRRGLARDHVLRACWNGEMRRGDESASDQSLMNKLAYWCNADPQAMIAAFLQSPYFAGKDEAHQKKCRRADYLPRTAAQAVAGLHSTAREDTARYRQKRTRDERR